MSDDSKNKVCFDCAGVPVIKRIIGNMRLAGISRFIVVVGHRAETVMDCLAGEEGIAYAYPNEQKGTGHAARCGLEVLSELNYSEKAIVSMGDKIVAPEVIRRLVAASAEAEVVWGVQPLQANPGGGRVVVSNGVPYGVVELADVAYHSLAGCPKEKWQGVLEKMGLNARKSEKVLERAKAIPPVDGIELNGRYFTAAELRQVQYANAGLYCFNIKGILDVLEHCGADNAQGEIYLTDALEFFARQNAVKLLEIKQAEDMLTFSTRPELRTISRYFLPDVHSCLEAIGQGRWKKRFKEIYGMSSNGQDTRYARLLEEFLTRHGNRKIMIARAPGRVNLMGRHIDHRGGCTNVITIDRDIVMVASPREDDVVSIANMDCEYEPAEFSISQCLALGEGTSDWLSYLEAPGVMADLVAHRGHWMNYIKSAVLRFQMALDIPLCGMDILVTGNIPVGAGLSSSSAIVVSTADALTGLNCLNITTKSFIELCGEGEWYVGSRGGASDHAAMKCGKQGYIQQLKFKPFSVGDSFAFSNDYSVIVADSCQKARKSEGSKDTFNARIAAYEFAFMLLRKTYAQRGWREFRELADVLPQSDIYRMLKQLPESMTRDELLKQLPTSQRQLRRIFATHEDPGEYDLRGVALFGISECLRSNLFGKLLAKGNYEAIGEIIKISHDGDRLIRRDYSDAVLEHLAESDAPVWRQCGAYSCSTPRIDELCDLLDGIEGVQGSSLVGAGLGGSVIALVKTDSAKQVIDVVNRKYYDKYNLPHNADIYRPSVGSKVIVDW